MKKRLSGISILLLFVLLFSTSIPVFAGSFEQKSVSDYTIYDLKMMTVEEKLELLNLFKQEYGLEDNSRIGGTNYGISPYWTSGNPYSPKYGLSTMETHELMTMDAIALLCEQGYFITKDATEALVITLYIARASALPDRDITGIGLVYAGHFYNPETGKSFLPVSSTARSNMTENYRLAYVKFRAAGGVDLESRQYKAALEYTGKMLHYVQDACEPHHSSNEIASPVKDTPHSEFEKNVFEHYAEYSRYYSRDSSEYNQCKTQSETDIGMIVHRAAVKSHVFIDSVNDLGQQGEWENIGGICVRQSIVLSAITLRIALEKMGVLVQL